MEKEISRKSSKVVELDISVLPVQCPICDESMLRITREHALSHGYASLSQYRKANGIKYLTLPQRSRENFKRLFNIDFKRWVVGWKKSSDEDMRYVTKIYDPSATVFTGSASKFPLSDGTFNDHFSGSNPLAVFAYGTHSRYFAFDVDSKDKAEGDTFRLITQLRKLGIADEHIHVSFSGSKGYHVEVFIDKNIRFNDWQVFADYVKYNAGLMGEEIEHRPTETNGHALKLPLTFHPTTKRFAGYCDIDTLQMYGVVQSHDYLNEIEQMDAGIIFDILRQARPSEAARRSEFEADRKRKTEEQRKEREAQREKENRGKQAIEIRNSDLFQSTEEKGITAKRILTKGLSGKGSRWLAMRDTLIPYLKIVQGNTAEGTAEILYIWTQEEIAKGNVGTSYDNCVIEINELMDSWYPKVTDFHAVVKNIEITRAEIDWVMSVIDEGGTRSARDLLWILLLLSKAYRERVERMGSFFASQEKVQGLLNKPKKISHTTIVKQRKWLVEQGYIEFEVPRNSYKKSLATVYKLSDIEEVTPQIIDSVILTDDTDGRRLLLEIAEKLYTPQALISLKML